MGLADPVSYPALFPDYDLAVAAEKAFKLKRERAPCAASQYAEQKAFQDELNVMEKIKELQPAAFQAMLLKGSSTAPVQAAIAPAPTPPAVEATPPAVEAFVQSVVQEEPAQAIDEASPETVIEETPPPAPEFTTTPEEVTTEPQQAGNLLDDDLLA